MKLNNTIKNYFNIIKNGLLDSNPILIQMLGTCPTLATTTSVSTAIGMGLTTAAVLVFTNLFISLLRKFIPKEIHIAAYIVIISGFVSAMELIIKAYLPALDRSLGVFLPLIVVNCIILARAEVFASKNKVLPSIIDGVGMGLGFAVALFIIGSIREILGAGTWLGINIFGSSYQPILLFIMPSGAFITLGFVLAAVNKFNELLMKKSKEVINNDD